MKFEEYLDTLPKNVLSGEDVQLPEKTFRDIFKFAALGKDDIFYHLGCHDEKGIEIANKEFNVKKAIGIDNNLEKIKNGENNINGKKIDVKLICQNIQEADFIKGVCDIPTHFIRGGNSDYINSEDKLIINKHFSDFSIVTIEGAGHWVHAEKPKKFYSEVMGFCLM